MNKNRDKSNKSSEIEYFQKKIDLVNGIHVIKSNLVEPGTIYLVNEPGKVEVIHNIDTNKTIGWKCYETIGEMRAIDQISLSININSSIMLLSRPLPGRNEILLQAECDKCVVSLWLNHTYGPLDRIRVGELRYSSDIVIATVDGLYGHDLIVPKDVDEFIRMIVVRIMNIDTVLKCEGPSYLEICNDGFWKRYMTEALELMPIHFVLGE